MTVRRRLCIAAITLLAIAAVSWIASDGFRALVFFAMQGVHLALHPSPPQCKRRADEFQVKVEVIRRDAIASLKAGAKREDVARFFASENIPMTFDQIGPGREATGTLYFKEIAECETIACGDDSSLIGVRVRVDTDGTVLSDPVVVGMYTDCI